MEIPLIILLAAAPFGAFDVIYFHLWKFRLYQRPESVKEEITHILRGILVPAMMGILLFGRPEGVWFWLVFGLFVFDTLNTLLDVILEPASRAPRIVPPSELSIHFLGTTLMGAAFATFILGGWDSRHHATALTPHTGSFLPEWFFLSGYGGVVAAFALVIFEASLFARALKRRAIALAE
jgi:hypothetical protein